MVLELSHLADRLQVLESGLDIAVSAAGREWAGKCRSVPLPVAGRARPLKARLLTEIATEAKP
jgi:hypothetical protein